MAWIKLSIKFIIWFKKNTSPNSLKMRWNSETFIVRGIAYWSEIKSILESNQIWYESWSL